MGRASEWWRAWRAARAATLGAAAMIGVALTPDAAAAECRWAQSVTTGANVYVCRDASGVWRPARDVRSEPPTLRREAGGRVARESEPVYDVDPAALAEAQALQEALNAVGCRAGRPDGLLGERTRRAIRCFQAREGLPETGALEDDQRALLDRRVAEGTTDPNAQPTPIEAEPAVAIDPTLDAEAGDAAQTSGAPVETEASADAATSAPASGVAAAAIATSAAADPLPAAGRQETDGGLVADPRLAPSRPIAAPEPANATLERLLGVEAGGVDATCREGMRRRQSDAAPEIVLFNRVCRAHAYAIGDEMLMLGYDARLAAAGDATAQAAMARRSAAQ